MLFKMHTPGFIDLKEKPAPFEFSDTSELIKHPALKRESDSRGFSHFAIDKDMVIAVYDGGIKWFVVGYVSEPKNLYFPQFSY